MHLVIDVGNTNAVFGIWEERWSNVWRWETNPGATEDEIAAFYFSLCRERGVSSDASRCLCANVVPSLTESLTQFGNKWLGTKVEFLTRESVPSMKVCYSPESAVGADRLANAVAAQASYTLPAVIVDFGTATTFDAIGSNGEYMGGSIMPGPIASMNALYERAAKLPKVELTAPENAIGRTTAESLQSGLILGYAGAIDALVRSIKKELGGNPTVIATGGLSSLYVKHSSEINKVDELLTLEGIRLALS
jgi:type III pantothenate kinase